MSAGVAGVYPGATPDAPARAVHCLFKPPPQPLRQYWISSHQLATDASASLWLSAVNLPVMPQLSPVLATLPE